MALRLVCVFCRHPPSGFSRPDDIYSDAGHIFRGAGAAELAALTQRADRPSVVTLIAAATGGKKAAE